MNATRLLQIYREMTPRMGGVYTSLVDFKRALKLLSIDISQGSSEADVTFVPKVHFGYHLTCWYGRGVRAQIDALFQAADGVILHGMYDETSLLVHRACTQRKSHGKSLKYIIVPHGMLDPWVFTYRGFRKKVWLALIGKRLIKDSAMVICASEGERRKIETKFPAANYRVCHWGVKDRFVPGMREDSRQKLHTQWGIPLCKKVLLLIGRICAMKQFALTARLFNQCGLREHCHLLIVGIPEERAEHAALSEAISRSDGGITLIPPQFGANKDLIFLAIDVLINISHRENFSYTTVEALSFDVPVLVSDGVDIHPSLAPFSCSRVVPIACGPQKFTTAITELIGNPGRPREAYSELFTEELFRKNIRSLVSECLDISTDELAP